MTETDLAQLVMQARTHTAISRLGHQEARDAIAWLFERADMTIVDTPPNATAEGPASSTDPAMFTTYQAAGDRQDVS